MGILREVDGEISVGQLHDGAVSLIEGHILLGIVGNGDLIHRGDGSVGDDLPTLQHHLNVGVLLMGFPAGSFPGLQRRILGEDVQVLSIQLNAVGGSGKVMGEDVLQSGFEPLAQTRVLHGVFQIVLDHE